MRGWGRDFSCLAERKRSGSIIVFIYVKAAVKRKAASSPYILWVESERM